MNNLFAPGYLEEKTRRDNICNGLQITISAYDLWKSYEIEVRNLSINL